MSVGKWEIMRTGSGAWVIFQWHCGLEECFHRIGWHIFPSDAEAIAAFAAGGR